MFLASAMMLAMALPFTSCSSESAEDLSINASNVDKTSTISFNVALPTGIVNRSRATDDASLSSIVFGDGTKATTLYYAVYAVTTENSETVNTLVETNYGSADQYEDGIFVDDQVEFVGHMATVSFALANGHPYKFVFWAQSPEVDCYTIDAEKGLLHIDYTKHACNDDNTDAFYACEALTYGDETANHEITLTRPFAQLNIGITDYKNAQIKGLDIEKSTITIAGAYNTLNLLTGEGSYQGTTLSSIELPAGEIPAKQDNAGVFPAKENGQYVDAEYVAMAYLLVGAEKQVFSLQFNYINGAGVELANTNLHYLDAVPLQRNHRTNLYGDLAVKEQTWTVKITPAFEDPDINDDINNYTHEYSY